MPNPVRNRIAARAPSDPAKALPIEASAKIAVLAIKSGLRPKRSPIGPATSAPAMIPILEKAKASANAAGGRLQTWVKSGTDQPIAPIS